MSIKNGQGKEIVNLPGLWEMLAKFAFAASVPVFLLGVSWAVWVTNKTFQNETEIRVLQVKEEARGSKAQLAQQALEGVLSRLSMGIELPGR